jgi:tetratricopeptide (TPR) repeat protein
MVNIVRPIVGVGLAILIAIASGCGDSNIKKAENFAAAKDCDQAIHYYTLAVQKDPENESIRYSLVQLYAQRLIDMPQEKVTPELVEETMIEVRPIAEPLMTDPNVKRYISLIYQLMAKRYAENGNDEKAAEAWTKVAEIEPSFAEAHYNLGVALTKINRHADALKEIEKAVDLNPYFISGYFALGNTLLHLGRAPEAIEQYKKALELNPDDAGIHHNLGVAYAQAGDNEKAIEQLEKALEINPNYMLAYQSLIEPYKATGQLEKAKEAEKKWNEFTKAAAARTAGGEAKPSSPEATK